MCPDYGPRRLGLYYGRVSVGPLVTEYNREADLRGKEVRVKSYVYSAMKL